MLSISDIATHDRLQPLNWAKEFPDVIAAGGFDCVFGNPPYGLARGEQIENYENEILKKHYSDVRSGKANKYMLFMAKGYELTAPHGCLSFVVPNSWLGIRSGRKLRQMFLSERSLASVHVFDFPVFQNSIVEPVVFTVDRQMQHDTIKLVRHPGPKTDTSSSEVPVDSCLKLPEQMIPTLSLIHISEPTRPC